FEAELMSNIMEDHPDNLFIRYLKARKYDASLAFKMLYDCVTFLYFQEFREIIRAGERELLQLPLESGLFYFHGHDLEGNIILYINPRVHNPKETPIDEFSKVLLYIIAQGYLMIGDKKATVVVDLKGLSLSNVEYASVKFLSDILAYYFPEVLRRVIIVNAPWIFSGIWSVITSFLDPVVKDKVQFCSQEDLQKFIAPDQLATRLGGTNTHEFNYKTPKKEEVMTKPHDAEYNRLTVEREELFSSFTDKTREWLDGSPVEAERDTLAQKLSENFRELSPYIWSPAYYHRNGFI
ncbi:CRAL/TRIO domain-containing protein, partial [Conidiobolus coronatus NRRL 28638]